MHAGVDDVVDVLPPDDPRIERDVAVHVAVKRQAPAKSNGRRRNPGKAIDHGKRLIEGVVPTPEHVGPVRVMMALIVAILVCVVAGLSQYRLAVIEPITDPLHRCSKERGVIDDLIVVDEKCGFAAHDRCCDQPHVTDRAVPHEAHARDHVRELELLHPAMKRPQLGRAEHERIDPGCIGENLPHAVLGSVLDAWVGRCNRHDDASEPLDALERAETGRKRAVGIDGRRMIIDRTKVVRNAAASAGPERRNDDARGHERVTSALAAGWEHCRRAPTILALRPPHEHERHSAPTHRVSPPWGASR